MTNKQIATALFAYFFGVFGGHKFYLGQTTQGFIYLLLSVLFCWTFVVPAVVGIVSIVEAILYLGMSKEEFIEKYGE